MPLVNVRLSRDEYADLKQFAQRHRMGMSEVIRMGISYVKMVHDTKSRKELEAVQEILISSVRELMGDTIGELEEKAKKKLRTSGFEEKFRREIAPELESKVTSLAESLDRMKPYRKRRGRPPKHRPRGRPSIYGV